MTQSTGPKDQAERLRELVESNTANQRSKVLGGIYYNKTLSHEANAGESPAVTRVVAISSGKGGVGKTNFAVNLGIALARSGLRVGLLDADLGLANIDIVLGIVPEYTLVHVLRGERGLTDAVIPGPEGLQIIAGGSGVYELANASPWQLERFVASFQELETRLDLLLIDTGAGIGRHVLTFLKATSETIIVTTPEPTAVTDAYGLIKMLHLSNPETQIQVVVNMAESLDEGKQVYSRLDVACNRFLGIKVEHLGSILRDPAVPNAVKEQVPFIMSHPNAKASKCVAQIAEKLSHSGRDDTEPGGLRAIFKRMINMVGA